MTARPTPYWALILLALLLAAWLVIVGGLKAAWAQDIGWCGPDAYWDNGRCVLETTLGSYTVWYPSMQSPPSSSFSRTQTFTCPSGTTRVLDEQYRPKCAKGLTDGEWK